MGRDLGSIYTAEWFARDFAELGPEFAMVARGLDRWARPRLGMLVAALDVGCGPAMLVDELALLNWDMSGFDGSPHGIAMVDRLRGAREPRMPVKVDANWGFDWPPVRVADVTDTPHERRRQIVICTEVAEHLPAEDAPTLVRYLTTHATRYVVFTAAPPGQGGHDHINEQPPEYWEELFKDCGWIKDYESTEELKDRWCRLRRLSHMTNNVVVFR